MASSSDVNKLIRQLRKQGFICKVAGGHWSVSRPLFDREGNPISVPEGQRESIRIACSPGSEKALKSMVGRLRNELGYIHNGRGGSRVGSNPLYQKEKQTSG